MRDENLLLSCSFSLSLMLQSCDRDRISAPLKISEMQTSSSEQIDVTTSDRALNRTASLDIGRRLFTCAQNGDLAGVEAILATEDGRAALEWGHPSFVSLCAHACMDDQCIRA